MWIPGNGFHKKSTRDGRNNGTFLVETSRKMKAPILFVTFNYRVGPFRILPGCAIEKAGLVKLDLQDQRQALKWIQENIAEFRNYTGQTAREFIQWPNLKAFYNIALIRLRLELLG
jgi:carboxylesterase type B